MVRPAKRSRRVSCSRSGWTLIRTAVLRVTPLPSRAEGAAIALPGRRNLREMPGPKSRTCSGLRAVSDLFTRGTFRALAAPHDGARGWIRSLDALIAEIPDDATLGYAFDRAFERISREYRSEYVFKNSIVDRLVFGRHSPRTAAPLLELGAGKSIVDVAVFNGTSTAYEIKTELDDFSRLLPQLRSYEQRFERVAVVTSPRLSHRVLDAVPDHIGVIALSNRGSLSELRAPTSGIGRLTRTGLFGLLRLSEALDILHRTHNYEIDVPRAQLWQRTRELFLELSTEVAHAEAVSQLRARGMRAAGLAISMPRSLRAMAYEIPLNSCEARRVHDKLLLPAAAFVS